MEQWIRDNFEIVNWENEDKSIGEGFRYIAPNGNKRITKFSTFVNNQSKFQDVINYWQQEGLNPPI